MNKKRKIIHIFTFIIFVIIIFVSLFWIFGWDTPRDKKLKSDSEKIIIEVENYKIKNGRLPENLREIGLSESESVPPYYDLSKDGLNYTVSYPGSTLGESTYYDSEDKSWHN